jgi:uncharacterized membrane protein YbhN (UPF0104 family)
MEACCSTLGALAVFGLALLWQQHTAVGRLAPLLGLVACGLVIATHPRVLRWGLNLALRAVRRPPVALSLAWRDVLVWTALMALNYLLLGAGFHLLLSGLVDVPLALYPFISGAFAVAGVVGVLALFAPSGIGVREGVMAVVLSAVMSPGLAAVAALVSRVWITLAEGLCAGLALLVVRRAGAGEPEAEEASGSCAVREGPG